MILKETLFIHTTLITLASRNKNRYFPCYSNLERLTMSFVKMRYIENTILNNLNKQKLAF